VVAPAVVAPAAEDAGESGFESESTIPFASPAQPSLTLAGESELLAVALADLKRRKEESIRRLELFKSMSF
jgi:hypothetical protein